MTDHLGATPSQRKRRILRVVLVLSLMINLLLIGVMAGGILRSGQFHPGPPQSDFRSLWRALPDDVRDTLRSQARRDGRPGAEGPRLSHAERRARSRAIDAQILEMLRADEFDVAGFAALLGGERERIAARLDAAQQAFAQGVGGMDRAQRLQMATRLEELWRDRMPRR